MLPKIRIKKILYATDLSDNARHAFAYAVSLAEMYNARITLLHVLPQESARLDAQIESHIGADNWRKMKEKHYQKTRSALIGKKREGVMIQDMLDQFCNIVKTENGSSFDTDEFSIKRGNPAEQILEVSRDRNCDLIVLGTHGTGEMVDLLMGSTARKVVRRSKIPVLVVRYPDDSDG